MTGCVEDHYTSRRVEELSTDRGQPMLALAALCVLCPAIWLAAAAWTLRDLTARQRATLEGVDA